ncbi:uncharacterized protein LOC110888512 [Helianthus annuus]|uniref:uncharacterized protein LOC110888512 n=1 Tax=Helianthus annuus TaxID=4232 RepID=UPI000B8F33AF|nr:uncharacterized protein LOC110888512 [Helianthus annuus]
MRQRRWVELLDDYDYKIRYHPGKANAEADALSPKSHVSSICCSQITSDLHTRIREAQFSSFNEANMYNEMKCGAENELMTKSDGLQYYLNRVWVNRGELRVFIMKEAPKSRYSIHLGADKMYHDLRIFY